MANKKSILFYVITRYTSYVVLFFLFSKSIIAANGEILAYHLSDYQLQNYESAINDLIKNFEQIKKISPGQKGIIALRIYTNSGFGLCTPHNLVLALSKCLEKHGFCRKNILIIGDSETSLRECQYLPKHKKEQNEEFYFHGMPVFWINDEQFYDENWVYNNPLASKELFSYNAYIQANYVTNHANNSRKSYLPSILMFGVDYWINLPVYVAHLEHGVIGSLIQSTIFNISNNKRFLENPTNCAAVAAQIYAIPEIKDHCLFHITSLERFQYVNSLIYNENYIRSMPYILLSSDPVALDSFCANIINRIKAIHGLKFLKELPLISRYAEKLKLGTTHFKVFYIKNKK